MIAAKSSMMTVVGTSSGLISSLVFARSLAREPAAARRAGAGASDSCPDRKPVERGQSLQARLYATEIDLSLEE